MINTESISKSIDKAQKMCSKITNCTKQMDPFFKCLIVQKESLTSYTGYDFDKLAGKIAKKIKDERIKRGLTQNDLAKITKMARPNITRIERGDKLSNLTTLVKIANALKVNLLQLFP